MCNFLLELLVVVLYFTSSHACFLGGNWSAVSGSSLHDLYTLQQNDTHITVKRVSGKAQWSRGDGEILEGRASLHFNNGKSISGPINFDCTVIHWNNTSVWCKLPGCGGIFDVKHVHVVSMNHLDVGFSIPGNELAYTYNVLNKYFDTYFPQAIKTARTLFENDPEGPQYIYTTHCWLVSMYLDCPSGMNLHCPSKDAIASFTDAVRRGWITWHSFPFNAEIELYDTVMLQSGIDLCHSLQRQFGVKSSIALSQRDVPGLTRAALPVLFQRGIRAITVGVNTYSSPPVVDKIFKWRDSQSKTVMYAMWHPGGYGSINLADCVYFSNFSHALAFNFRGDNAGPHTPPEIIKTFDTLKKEFPNAIIKASTYSNFTDFLLSSNSELLDTLPEVTSEIGDTWLYGIQSDPIRTASARAEMRCATECIKHHQCNRSDTAFQNFTRMVLKLGEHTWGLTWQWLDAKTYQNEDLQIMLNSSTTKGKDFRNMQKSWPEQRSYVDKALEALQVERSSLKSENLSGNAWLANEIQRELRELIVDAPPSLEGYVMQSNASQHFNCSHFVVGFDPTSGAVAFLRDKLSGRQWSDSNSPSLFQYQYQTLNETDFDNFMKQYNIQARPQAFGKRNLTANANVESKLWLPKLNALYVRSSLKSGSNDSFLLHLTMPKKAHSYYGSPHEIWIRMDFDTTKPSIFVDIYLFGKTATRLPEAHWFSINASLPKIQPPSTCNSWMIEKFNEPICGCDIVTGGSSHLHVSGEQGARWGLPSSQNSFCVKSIDAGLISIGIRSAFPIPMHPLAPGLVSSGPLFLNLFNNFWSTNYPQWYPFQKQDINSRYRIEISIGPIP